LQPISAITAQERSVVVAQRSAVLGTTVACDVVSVPLDFRSIRTLDSDRARAVLALHPDFSGHVVRVLRGDLTTQAELLLSRPEAEDLFAWVKVTEVGLILIAKGLCSWVFTNSLGQRASPDVKIQSRITRKTTRFDVGVSLTCSRFTRVEVQYTARRLLVHFADGLATERPTPGSAPRICMDHFVQLTVKLPSPVGNRKLVVLSYLAAS
jgi:hypothetical protein